MILRPLKRWPSPCMRPSQGKKVPGQLSTCKLAACPSSLFISYSYTHDIEALSCDELLIDSSALLAELCISPEEVAKAIRVDIKEKTGCCASVGMGKSSFETFLLFREIKQTAPMIFLFSRVQHPVGSARNP